ncbi:MAG: alpha/beta fold hydrolase [Deltaproteobacteria bacterium]|nr:alpha/beta fold hydrolase [Deltaproteobacteria bacterium]
MTTKTADTLTMTHKSTNVRSRMTTPLWLRLGFSTAGYLAPELTAAVAERLFFRTRRTAARAGERDVLQSATAVSIAGMKAWTWGEGPTVLLVHGWNGRASQLGSVVTPLVAQGYRVVGFDAFGHGDSPGSSMSIPELASCIRQVADELGGVYGVIAHSMGGAATTLALSEGLEIERAVFISPPSDPNEFLDIFSAAIGISGGVRTRVKRRVEHRLGIRIDDLRANVLAPSMRIPLLVIHDRDDKEVPVDAGQSIAGAWPNAELIITEGLGHQRILRAGHVTNVAVSFIDAVQHLKIAA